MAVGGESDLLFALRSRAPLLVSAGPQTSPLLQSKLYHAANKEFAQQLSSPPSLCRVSCLSFSLSAWSREGSSLFMYRSRARRRIGRVSTDASRRYRPPPLTRSARFSQTLSEHKRDPAQSSSASFSKEKVFIKKEDGPAISKRTVDDQRAADFLQALRHLRGLALFSPSPPCPS